MTASPPSTPIALAYDTTSVGRPALLFLHAWALDRRMWDPQQRPLAAAGYRVLRCDLPGHGLSPAAQPGRDDAEDVIELLRAIAPDGAVLVGSSFGGRVAQDVALRAPELVSALVLISPGTFGRAPSADLLAFAAREHDLLAVGDLDGAVRLNIETFLTSGTDEATRGTVYRQLHDSFTAWLGTKTPTTARVVSVDPARITAPTLIVTGGKDLAFFRDANPAEQVPGARHLRLEWAGHLPNLERPDEMNQLLLDFLRATAGSAPTHSGGRR
jgi:3-oxoadipate enol-lactonase